jgi:hypothetical protein
MDTSPDIPGTEVPPESRRAPRLMLAGAALVSGAVTVLWMLYAGVFGQAVVTTGTLPAAAKMDRVSEQLALHAHVNCVTLALIRHEQATRSLPCDSTYDKLHHHEGAGRQDLAALSEDFIVGIARAIARSETD